jgi:hypothetical protein
MGSRYSARSAPQQLARKLVTSASYNDCLCRTDHSAPPLLFDYYVVFCSDQISITHLLLVHLFRFNQVQFDLFDCSTIFSLLSAMDVVARVNKMPVSL